MGSAASAGKGERHKEGSKTQAARMPEVEKQSAVASEGSGESLEKPGGLSFEVVLEEVRAKKASVSEAEGSRESSKINGSFNFGEACSGGKEKRGGPLELRSLRKNFLLFAVFVAINNYSADHTPIATEFYAESCAFNSGAHQIPACC